LVGGENPGNSERGVNMGPALKKKLLSFFAEKNLMQRGDVAIYGKLPIGRKLNRVGKVSKVRGKGVKL